ncbi:MAG: YaaR family protein [Bacillota bacterium]
MKIDSSNLNRNKQINNLVSSTNKTEKSSFQDKLEAVNEENVREKLDTLLDYVDQYGEKLKETMDKKDLQAYKEQVKEFLKIIQKEFARTRQSFSWDNQGNLKTYMIIEKINNQMEKLQEEFIQDQADVLEVVSRIDEIRGLLLDLYI